jgi:RimJ/RimL family protein N-acetyltransferase
MIINKYNIKLTRLTIDDLELVRNMRNSEDIKRRMIFQKEITKEQQIDWFKNIDNFNNVYFLINTKGKKIGVINGKNADFVNKTSEGGIFIWDKNYLNSIIPSLCAIIMHDYNFHICEFNSTYVKVLKDNKTAINFNKSIGYEIIDENPHGNFYLCELTRDKYIDQIEKHRKSLGKLYNDIEPLNGNDFTFSNLSDEDIKRYFGPLPKYLIDKVNMVLKKENRLTL